MGQAKPTAKEIGGKKASRIVKRRTQSKKASAERKLKAEKKKIAVLRTQAWRLRLRLVEESTNRRTKETEAKASSGFTSYSAERRTLRKVKDVLPQTPMKKARVIECISRSQNTSKILEKEGIILSPASRKQLNMGQDLTSTINNKLAEAKPKGGCRKDRLIAYKQLKDVVSGIKPHRKPRQPSYLTKYFEVKSGIQVQKRMWWESELRKRRKDRLSPEVKEAVADFYHQPEISREVPGKAAVVVTKEKGKTVALTKHLMSMTMEEAYKRFKEIKPEIKIGLTSFKKLKPFNVKKVSELSRRTCLCTTCCNLALKLDALKRFVGCLQAPTDELKKLSGFSKADMSLASLCDMGNQVHPNLRCLERSCTNCNSKVQNVLKPLDNFKDEQIQWHHWEYVTLTAKDKQKRIMSCVEKNTTIAVLLKSLEADMHVYPIHIFRANWQHQQMALSIERVQSDEAIILMDYSENYRCVYQNEVQSGFFDQRQVTIHPAMAYYKEGEIPVRHAIIAISDDTHHDAHLTKVIEDRILNLISHQPGMENLSSVIEWTDGCSAQYKCKTSVSDIANSEMKMNRNYFETSHGKSPCDGLGSIVKNSCLRSVTCGSVVLGDAQAIFKFCRQKFGHGPQKKEKANGQVEISKWDFIFVSEDDVDHSRPEVFPLKGIRAMHALKSTGKSDQIFGRKLSCFCVSCISSEDGPQRCQNANWVEPWDVYNSAPTSNKSSILPHSL